MCMYCQTVSMCMHPQRRILHISGPGGLEPTNACIPLPYTYLQERHVGLHSEGVKMVVDSEQPHFVGVDPDILSTGLVFYYLKVSRLGHIAYLYLHTGTRTHTHTYVHTNTHTNNYIPTCSCIACSLVGIILHSLFINSATLCFLQDGCTTIGSWSGYQQPDISGLQCIYNSVN